MQALRRIGLEGRASLLEPRPKALELQMTRTTCLLALVMFSCSDPQEPFREVSFEHAQELAAREQKVVLIDFFTTWCGPCKKLDATTWKDSEVLSWMAKNCIALKLDAEQNTELAARFHVGAYPTIVLLKPDGTVIDSLVGYRDARTFLADSAAALAGKSSLARAMEVAKSKESSPIARHGYGKELARAGRYEDALAEFLWCFDEGRKSLGFQGVRLSFLLGDISNLGAKYPPALRALEQRRDAAEARIVAGPCDREDVADASALNRELKSPQRNLALYDHLHALGPLPSNVKVALTGDILVPLVAARRYTEVVDLFDKPEGYVKGSIRMYESSSALRAGMDQADVSEIEDSLRTSIVERCAPIYESLVGAGRTEKATEIAELLIAFAPGASTYISLIELAARAGSVEIARAVGAQGLAAIKIPAERSAIEAALGRLRAPK